MLFSFSLFYKLTDEVNRFESSEGGIKLRGIQQQLMEDADEGAEGINV